MKKKLCLIATLVAFFAMTAVSFAAVTVDVDVTSEPIMYQSPCDKAGGITLNFVSGAILESGDRITADLPRNVYICKKIDFVVALGGVPLRGYPIGVPFPAEGVENQGPVTGDGQLSSVAPNLVPEGDTLGRLAFHVYGNKGSRTLTIDVLGETMGDGSGLYFADGIYASWAGQTSESEMILEILDSRNHHLNSFEGPAGPFGMSSGMWSDYDLDHVSNYAISYDDQTLPEDNTYCIDTSLYVPETVNISWDSADQKYTFDPSSTEIAHARDEAEIELADCNKKECGNIIPPGQTGQESFLCTLIDNEAGNIDFWADSDDGYCPGTHRQNRAIIQMTDGTPFPIDDDEYGLEMEIYVQGPSDNEPQNGDQGVYFAQQVFRGDGFDTKTEACSGNALWSTTDLYLYNAAGQSNADPQAVINASLSVTDDQDCDIADENKIVRMRTINWSTLGLNGTSNDFLWTDIPNIIWGSELAEGSTIYVKITLLRFPCGEIFSDWICIGTLGCDTEPEDVCKEYTGFYPLVARDGNYASVLHVTNTGSADIGVTGYIYETDGDIWMFTGTVPANGVAAYNVYGPGVVLSAAPGSAGDGVPGSTMGYAKIVADGMFTGVAFITNGTNGESMGYVIDSPTGVVVDCP